LSLTDEVLRTMGEGLNDPSIFKAVFLAGGPGSGKSFVTKHSTGGLGLKVINSDDQLIHLRKKAGLSIKMHNLSAADAKDNDVIRLKAKALTDILHDNFLVGRLGVIIDGTGKNYKKLKEARKFFHTLGYDTSMIFVNTTEEAAQKNNIEREKSVPPKLVTKGWEAVQKNMGKFQSLFGDKNFHIIDTSQPLTPKSPVFTKLWKKIKAFANMPVHNPIAKKWIEDEKILRKAK